MRTINISVSEDEYKKFGLRSDKLSFAEFVELVGKELAKQRLKESIKMAAQYGLSGMSMDEITKEVKAVRKDAENYPGH